MISEYNELLARNLDIDKANQEIRKRNAELLKKLEHNFFSKDPKKHPEILENLLEKEIPPIDIEPLTPEKGHFAFR